MNADADLLTDVYDVLNRCEVASRIGDDDVIYGAFIEYLRQVVERSQARGVGRIGRCFGGDESGYRQSPAGPADGLREIAAGLAASDKEHLTHSARGLVRLGGRGECNSSTEQNE